LASSDLGRPSALASSSDAHVALHSPAVREGRTRVQHGLGTTRRRSTCRPDRHRPSRWQARAHQGSPGPRPSSANPRPIGRLERWLAGPAKWAVRASRHGAVAFGGAVLEDAAEDRDVADGLHAVLLRGELAHVALARLRVLDEDRRAAAQHLRCATGGRHVPPGQWWVRVGRSGGKGRRQRTQLGQGEREGRAGESGLLNTGMRKSAAPGGSVVQPEWFVILTAVEGVACASQRRVPKERAGVQGRCAREAAGQARHDNRPARRATLPGRRRRSPATCRQTRGACPLP